MNNFESDKPEDTSARFERLRAIAERRQNEPPRSIVLAQRIGLNVRCSEVVDPTEDPLTVID